MRKLISLLLIISLFVVGCAQEVEKATQDLPVEESSEEVEISDGLSDLDDIDSLENDLDNLGLDDLDNLDFE